MYKSEANYMKKNSKLNESSPSFPYNRGIETGYVVTQNSIEKWELEGERKREKEREGENIVFVF